MQTQLYLCQHISSVFVILCIHNFGGFQEKIGKSAEMICPISFYRWAPSLLDHFRKMDEAPFFLWMLLEVPKYHHTMAHWPFQSFNPKLDTEQKRGSAILQQKICTIKRPGFNKKKTCYLIINHPRLLNRAL